MKRSSRITLIAMATVSCLALTACDDRKSKDTEVMGDFYDSIQSCMDAKDPNDPTKPLYTEEQCKTEFDQAEKEHVENAPKFGSLADCENQFGPGACGAAPTPTTPNNTTPATAGSTTIINNTTPSESHDSGAGVFMPFMMGYMFGHASSPPTPVYYGPGSWRDSDKDNRPLYSSGGPFYNQASSKPLGYIARDVGGYKETITTPSNATGGRPSPLAVNSSMNKNGFSPGKFSARSSAFGSPAARSYSPPAARASTSFGSRASVGSSARGGFGGSAAGHSSGG